MAVEFRVDPTRVRLALSTLSAGVVALAGHRAAERFAEAMGRPFPGNGNDRFRQLRHGRGGGTCTAEEMEFLGLLTGLSPGDLAPVEDQRVTDLERKLGTLTALAIEHGVDPAKVMGAIA